jgi:hypothetical protein
MASYFLNAARHITLLESDAELIALVRTEDDKDIEIEERTQSIRQEIAELNSDPYL